MNDTTEMSEPNLEHGAAIEKVANQLAELAMREQREIHGEFADESKLRAGARARLRYLIAEGFAG